MSFIGIIANEKRVNEIKRKISKIDKNNILQIIEINSRSIDNITNIKFETIVIIDSIEKLYKRKEQIRNLIKKAEYLILNADLEIESSILSNISIKTITYGLKSKSTITASSIKEDNIIICIQREIKSIKSNTIEPKEIKIKVRTSKIIYEILAIYSIIMLYNDQIYVKFEEKINFF